MARTLYLAFPVAVLCACSGGQTVTKSERTPASIRQIYEIQGHGPVSPVDGQRVRVPGVVTGDFQDSAESPGLGGFYIQAENPDRDPQTSDGVFVYDRDMPAVEVYVGDRVIVTGSVRERYGETQVVAEDVTVVGLQIVAPAVLALPAAASILNSDGERVADLESVEGMLVRLDQPLTVTDLFDLERYGEVLLSSGGRLMHFTNGALPSAQGYAVSQEQHALQTLRLGDGTSMQYVSPIPFLSSQPSPDRTIRVGDSVTNLVGNIRYSRASGSSGVEAFRLIATESPRFVTANPRPEGIPDPGGSLKIASFNAQNYFATADSGAPVCGPMKNSKCRGADSAHELERQNAKTITALTMLDADIVGLVELENNENRALQEIVDGLNAAAEASRYAFVATGNVGTDAIRNGFIFDRTAVTPIGGFAVLDSSVDPRFVDSRNRPSIAQTFRHHDSGGILTLVVNHLKSKGSPCDDAGDPNLGNGQANCNRTRSDAASAIAEWLSHDPTGSKDDDVLLIGDFNSYLREEPLTRLEAAGYSNLLRMSGDNGAYSFVFQGESGALDHAFASPSLLAQFAGALEWHINADEAAVLDYNLEFDRDPVLFDPATPYRVSDHDPVVIGLQLQ